MYFIIYFMFFEEYLKLGLGNQPTLYLSYILSISELIAIKCSKIAMLQVFWNHGTYIIYGGIRWTMCIKMVDLEIQNELHKVLGR